MFVGLVSAGIGFVVSALMSARVVNDLVLEIEDLERENKRLENRALIDLVSATREGGQP
jgi:hypothetical protein